MARRIVNLEQVRAKNALNAAKEKSYDCGGENGGQIVKKIPPLVMNHGLLAALAFACEKKEGSGWRNLFDELAKHLADKEIALLPRDCVTAEKLLKHLTGKDADSLLLRRCTMESLAWLDYARRFIGAKESNNGRNREGANE